MRGVSGHRLSAVARRLKRRLAELEEVAVHAQRAAAVSAALAEGERTRAAEREIALRDQAKRETNTLREAFDDALERAGVVLFQQSAKGPDCFYVSTSMRSILGWSPPSFLRPGSFRGIVHPDDLKTFDLFMGAPVSHDGGDESGIESNDLIDLTYASGHQNAAVTPITASQSLQDHAGDGPAARDEVIIRFRTSDGDWLRLAVRPDSPVEDPVGVDSDADDGASQGADAVGSECRPRTVAGALITVEQALGDIAVADWFTKLVEHDPAGCLILEFEDSADPFSLVIRATNAAAKRMFNIEVELNRGIALDEILAGSSAQLLRSAVFDVYHTGEAITAERLSFSEIPGVHLDMRVMRLDDGAIGVTFKDVTSIVAIENRLRKQASHDALTGLPSRTLLEERLDLAAAKASHSAPIAVILVDIVGLSAINEHYGLNYGDDLLKKVGDRLVHEMRGLSVVARFGDDEFALVTTTCCSTAEAVGVAQSVNTTLAHPFDIRGHLVDVKFSIGMAIAPEHGHDARALLRDASAALRDAKDTGLDVVLFQHKSDSESIRRLAVLSELRESLERNELELRFQPQLDLHSGRVRKVEAVPRWSDDRDPSRMSVELLELAEQSALIQPLTRWLLTEATRASRELRQLTHRAYGTRDEIVVSLNLSTRNLFDPDLETFIELMVRSGELESGQLELEINEPGLMDDPAGSQEILERLSGQGVNFVVDQFGTGYTSLATMRHLAVRGLKIDRSYLASIATVPSDAAVIRSTIELSHELGLFAGATGVTDLEVLSLLVEYGCDFAQGPFLSEPVPLAELPGRIAEIEDIARAWLGAEVSY